MWTDLPAPVTARRADAMHADPDALLAAAVAAALARRRGIPPGRVEAAVCHGWVTLTGELEWLYQRAEAYDAVHELPGVVGCTNRISVSPRTLGR